MIGLAVVLVLLPLVAAVLGPRLLRRAAPTLVRAPRVAVALLGGAVALWLATALAVGPALAWIISGPALLPEPLALTCQRCLTAASPFARAAVDVGIPALLLLAVPLLASISLAVGASTELRRRWSRSRRTSRWMLAHATPRRVLGHDIQVISDKRPFAFALPARHRGTVLSTAALAVLDRSELAAVLEHEAAHLRQRHHVVTAVMASVARCLRPVPLVAAAEAALPHYLEIAADNEARRRVGTPALVSALVTLGERAAPDGAGISATALHAAGPQRLQELVRPAGPADGRLATLGVSAGLALLGALAAVVLFPYAAVALTGCG